MIKNGTIQEYLEVVVDDYSVEDCGDIGEYEYEAVEEQEDTTAPIAVHRQVQWERDIAIDQLHSYGVHFGEKAELQNVRHGMQHQLIKTTFYGKHGGLQPEHVQQAINILNMGCNNE